MDGTTLCPHCQTRFKISEVQLAARAGMVRCGQCRQAFDARAAFVRNAEEEGAQRSAVEPLAASVQEEAAEVTLRQAAPLQPEHVPVLLLGGQPSPRQRRLHKLLGLVSVLLLLLLFFQVTFFFRVELAGRYPNLKPVLADACAALGCRVGLPQEVDLMSIESSELEAVPQHDNQIILHVLLRNRANVAQAYPRLELTLKDEQDRPLVRRILLPVDYLSPQDKESDGLAGNQELQIRLPLDIHDLKPVGYRLSLFYPG